MCDAPNMTASAKNPFRHFCKELRQTVFERIRWPIFERVEIDDGDRSQVEAFSLDLSTLCPSKKVSRLSKFGVA